MNHIGCDCHISSLECAVVNERGQETKKQRVNTGVKELMEFVKSIPKPRTIINRGGSACRLVIGGVYCVWGKSYYHRSKNESVDRPGRSKERYDRCN